MAYNFPAIVHRIESSLIAQDACNLLGLTIRPDLALEALTKDSDNSGEQDAEQLNFQAGMGNNYERLEFLGDCFLKMATTIAIYSHFPDKDEFLYHVERMLLICNRNLFNNALEVNLQEYIRSMSFDRRSWYPAGLKLLRGKVTCPREKHTLGYKSIADVCEALIGAAYLSTFEQNDMDMAVRAVSVMVKDKMHDYTAWSQYRERWTKPAWVTAEATAVDVDMARKFAQRLGYSFRHPRLLRCAFMHPSSNSQLYYKLPSYQQLEFLGDALFDMVCVDFLFHRFPGADPQWLTEHKMAMVSNQFLACLAVELGFHRCIVVCLSQLQKKIRDYVDVMEVARSDAKQAAVAAGKPETEYARHYWCEDTSSGTASGALAGVSAPKCLPDVVEAYIGALFLDSGCDLAVVRDFFRRHVQPFFEDMHIYDTYANNHPVTFLANLMGTRLHCNDWRLINREIPADGKAAAPTAARSEDGDRGDAAADETAAERLHEDGLAAIIKGTRVVSGLMVHGTPWHVVSADSIRYAKVRAAKRALKEMDGLDPAAFRAKYKCNCPLPEEDAKATEACDDAGADEDPAAATGGQGDSHPGSRGGEELVVEVS